MSHLAQQVVWRLGCASGKSSGKRKGRRRKRVWTLAIDDGLMALEGGTLEL